jgi:hypothetical protein
MHIHDIFLSVPTDGSTGGTIETQESSTVDQSSMDQSSSEITKTGNVILHL